MVLARLRFSSCDNWWFEILNSSESCLLMRTSGMTFVEEGKLSSLLSSEDLLEFSDYFDRCDNFSTSDFAYFFSCCYSSD